MARTAGELRLRMNDEEKAWLEAQAAEAGCSSVDVLRRLMRQAQETGLAVRDPDGLVGPVDLVEQKRRAVELTRELYNLAPVAQALGVRRQTLAEWEHADPEFGDLLDEARELHVHQVEHELLRIGMGLREKADKAAVTALLAWLNAHHPGYGRIRTETIMRVMGPLVDRLVTLASKVMPRDAALRFGAELARTVESALLRSSS